MFTELTEVSLGRGLAPFPGPTVLLVDDDALVLEVLADTIGGSGLRVLPFPTGEECLRGVNGVCGPVVLVTDVNLSDCSGRTLANAVLRRRPGSPVVFVTGMVDTETILGPLESGEILLQKPFGTRELMGAIESAGVVRGAVGTPVPV